eukprot:gene1001-4076_t
MKAGGCVPAIRRRTHLAGFSYFQPALPRRPADRSPSLEAYTNFIPTAFNDGARKLLREAAARIRRRPIHPA